MISEDKTRVQGDQIPTEAEPHGVGFQLTEKMQVNKSFESSHYALGSSHLEMGVKPHAEPTPFSHTWTSTTKGVGFDMSPVTSSQLLQSSAIQKNKSNRKLSGTVRYAFRTRSETDVLDDGFKWRKYGKKSVKTNPNLRHYYRCADSRCDVKKMVERDPQDKETVITTYEGNHNHSSPSIVCYIGKPSLLSQQLSMDPYPAPCI